MTAAEPVAPTPATAVDLPGLPSPALPAAPPTLSPGDHTDPPSMDGRPRRPASRSFDPERSVPIASETTSTRRVFQNPDGSKTLEAATRPVRYQPTPGGPWLDIDLTLAPTSAGDLAARAAPGSPRLAPTAGGMLASVDTTAGTIGLRHPGSAPVPATLDGRRATYPGALPRADVVVELTDDGFKESVVLADPDAAPSYREEFVLPAGASARQGPAGVEFTDAAGAVVATYANGVAVDAAG
ncbi:MAG TPA: hypothetical protein VFO65_04835, partial [Acidimicrobiales bacterium]|nr:hypothetical protein [Acidimicrobiales bacterium]